MTLLRKTLFMVILCCLQLNSLQAVETLFDERKQEIELESSKNTQDFIYPAKFAAVGLVSVGLLSASSASISKTGPLGKKTRNFTFKYIVIPGTLISLGTSYFTEEKTKKELKKLTSLSDEYKKLIRLTTSSTLTGEIPKSAKFQATLNEYSCKYCKTDKEKMVSFSSAISQINYLVEEFVEDERVSIDEAGIHNIDELTTSKYIVSRISEILGDDMSDDNFVIMLNILRVGLFSAVLEDF